MYRDTEFGRAYVIVELSEKDFEAERVKHQLWVECCGNYCYDLPEDHKPTKPIELFYETYPPSKKEWNYVCTGKPVAHMVD